MSMFSFFFPRRQLNKGKPAKLRAPKARLHLEALEDRFLPSSSAISGYVFADANNNGIYDPGETPIANAPVELLNANNVVIGNAITDATGFYQFNQDGSVNQTPATATETITFPSTQTDFTLPGSAAQFDPSLGQLESVQITHAGSITSDIKVENTSPTSKSTISGTVGGSLELTGPGVDSVLTMSQNAGTFKATAFDGTLDYAGTSGIDFGPKTASGTQTATLTGADMTPYIGTGDVNFTENAAAASYASGGGNLNMEIGSSGTSTVTISYTYIPSNSLKAGNYTVVQTVQPTGYMDGKISSGGVVLSHQPNVDVIPITLNGTNNSTNNDFGKLSPASISGYVYFDANDNGSMDAGETGIPGATITLTGANDLGPVAQTITTNASGFYQFTSLRPGTYTVQETAPSGWIDGKDTAGSLGGTVTQDQIAAINVPSGGASANNDFGELKPSSVSGYVYFDANDNGIMDAGETGIAGATVTLTGMNDQGPVSLTTTTNANGFYQFTTLRLGSYTVQETPPANWLDGKDSAGSLGGIVSHDQIAAINVPSGTASINNDFAELEPASLSGYVYLDANNNGIKDPGEAGIAGTVVTLTGFNDQGPIVQQATTAVNGFYQFQNLRPGSYVLTETPPANYFNGKDAIGSQGGTVGTDTLTNIMLAAGVLGINNNFAELPPAESDLGIVKTASASSVLVGSTISYTLTVTNYGTSTAQNVQVVDNLPADAIYESAAGTGWTISEIAGTITATLSSLKVGTAAPITVTVKAPGVADSLTNTATVTSSTPDDNLSNNTSSVTTTVFNQPGTVFPTGIVPVVGTFGVLPTTSKVQLFSFNAAPYINPVLFGLETFISGTYETVLGRAPTYTELMAGVSQLQAGVSSTTVATALWNSTAHRTQQVTSLYKTFLGRSPTAAELTAGVQALQSGTSEINLSLNLVNSAEYQASHPTASTMVAGLYMNILNETPSASTELQAASALANQSVSSLAQSLITSTASLSTIVNDAYEAILRRPATSAEIQSWVAQLQANHVTLDQMQIALLVTPEFYQLAEKSTSAT